MDHADAGIDQTVDEIGDLGLDVHPQRLGVFRRDRLAVRQRAGRQGVGDVMLDLLVDPMHRIDDVARHLAGIAIIFLGLMSQHDQHVLGRQRAFLGEQFLVGLGREAAIDGVDRPERGGRIHDDLVGSQRDHRAAGHGDIGHIGNHLRFALGIVMPLGLGLRQVLLQGQRDHVGRPGIATQRVQHDNDPGSRIGLPDRGDSLEGLVEGDLLLGAVATDKIIAQIMDEIDQDGIAALDLLAEFLVVLLGVLIARHPLAAQLVDLALVRHGALAVEMHGNGTDRHDQDKQPGPGHTVEHRIVHTVDHTHPHAHAARAGY